MTVLASELREGMVVETARHETYEVLSVMWLSTIGMYQIEWRWQDGDMHRKATSAADTPWGARVVTYPALIIEEF